MKAILIKNDFPEAIKDRLIRLKIYTIEHYKKLHNLSYPYTIIEIETPITQNEFNENFMVID